MGDNKPICAWDTEKEARWQCDECGPLCSECDAVLHNNPRNKSHNRVRISESVSSPTASDVVVLTPSPQPTKKKKPVRVWIDGCFDLCHFGHANAIRQARALGDVVVVGVHPDDEIIKHKGPPLMKQEERVACVKACKWVDEVVDNCPYDVSSYMDTIVNVHKCDIIVHGDDASRTADGADAYEKVKAAGRFRTIKRTEGVSTTELVGRMLLLTKSHHEGTDDLIRSASTGSLSALSDDGSEDSLFPKQKASELLMTSHRLVRFSNGRTPKEDDVVVYVDGAFDLFHNGHTEFLRKARELGNYLLVGIHDDHTANSYAGHNFPIMNLHERVLSVLQCRYVDDVIIGAPLPLTKDMIVTMNIKVVAHGTVADYGDKFIGSYDVPKKMGIFKTIESSVTLRSKDIVERVIANRMRYQERQEKKKTSDKSYLENKEFVQEL